MAEENAAQSAAPKRGVRTAASALMTIAILVAGGLAFRWSPPTRPGATDYRNYLAASGEPVLVTEAGNRTPPMTVTSATDGFLGTIAALPRDVAERLVVMVGADARDLQWERSFSTQVNPDGSILSMVVVSPLGPEGYTVALSAAINGGTLTYDPPRIELPATVRPGVTWSSEGILNFQGPLRQRDDRFVYRGAIEEASERDGRSCVTVRTALDQRSPGTEPYLRTARSTWCAGRGSVESFVSETATTLSVVAPGAVRLGPAPRLLPEPVSLGATLASPFLSPDISIAPVVMDGLVISTSGALGDLDAVRPHPGGQRVEWIQHPGGAILGMAADESQLYVTTTTPMLTAFDAAGRIHWLNRLPDAAVGTPLCANGLVVVALLDGTLRGYDSATGEQRWVNQFADVIAVPPVAGGGNIIAADVSGLVKAISLDGETLWSNTIDPVRAPMTGLPDGGVLVQDAGGTLRSLDRAGGVRWSADLDVVITGPGALLDAVAVVPAGSTVLGIRIGDGAQAWRRDELPLAKVHPTGWLAAANLAGRLTADGRLTDQSEWESDPTNAVLRRNWPIAVGGQALVMHDWGAMTAVGRV